MATVNRTLVGYACIDCVIIDANGPGDDDDKNRAYAEGMSTLDALFPGTHAVLSVDDEPHFMAWADCIVCDTLEGGDRYKATLTLFNI